ncbi:MAG: PRTRC system ThiF family protein [Candidatus Competibacteraceae bacterium]|jgi:PRTRC genetic system ThiF family protein|nr:PRTRC system ThiF family protein [Candidatus Competibacteraceae bacterium]
MRFYIPSPLIEQPVTVWLIGVGGTGSELLDGLVRLHTSLLALGHPGGLQVTAWDGDTVSTANIGRQRFWPADVGHNKATVSIHRLNLFAGLDWEDRPEPFVLDSGYQHWPDLLITCVDQARLRADIGESGHDSWQDCLWLDTGNDAYTGQVILGHLNQRERQPLRLPSVYDFYGGDLVEGGQDTDNTPSCGLAMALNQQSLSINRLMADLSLALLFNLFRDGFIEHHGYFVDLRQGLVTPLRIDPDTWAFMGYAQNDDEAGGLR